MKRVLAAMLSALAVFLTTGCDAVGLRADLRDAPYPVMCSPIMRIGDTAPLDKDLRVFDEFDTSVEFVASGGHSTTQRREGDYIIQESRTTHFQGRSDSLAYDIHVATANRPDVVVVVDEIKSVNFSHNSIIYWITDKICLRGKVVLLSEFEQ